MAGALGVGLAKRGAYRLGERPLPSSPEAIRRARRVLGVAAAIAVALATGVALLGNAERPEACCGVPLSPGGDEACV